MVSFQSHEPRQHDLQLTQGISSVSPSWASQQSYSAHSRLQMTSWIVEVPFLLFGNQKAVLKHNEGTIYSDRPSAAMAGEL